MSILILDIVKKSLERRHLPFFFLKKERNFLSPRKNAINVESLILDGKRNTIGQLDQI